MRVPHITLYLSSRHEGGHAVYHDDVEGAAPHQGVGYLEGLFAVVRLGEVEVLEVHADGLGVGGVEGVLGVDEGGEATGPLGLGNDVQGEGRLAAGLDRKSTRLNSSHANISYAVFCLKKKNT